MLRSDAGVVSPSEMKLPGTLGLRAGRVVCLIDGGLPSSHGSLFLGTCGGTRGGFLCTVATELASRMKELLRAFFFSISLP